MLEFFADCIRLFSMTFNATYEVEFFAFLYGFLVLQVSIWLFVYLSRGTRKL